MGDFKIGDRVTVRSFEGVIASGGVGSGKWIVREAESGASHVLDSDMLTKVLPYKDGAKYIDMDGNMFTFHAANGEVPAHWTIEGTRGSTVYDLDFAVRPLREIGPQIEE